MADLQLLSAEINSSMDIKKNKIMEHVAGGDIDTYLEQLAECLEPTEQKSFHENFSELVAELHAEGRIKDYCTVPWGGISLPLNLEAKD
jgi:hypothetical protein